MRWIAVGLLVLALAGCSEAGTPVAVDRPTPATTSAVTPDRSVFQRDPSIVNTNPLAIESWTATPGGVAVHFTTGSPACYGVDADIVGETDTTVTVDLRSGSLPAAVGTMCTMIAVYGTLDLPLAAPLGERTVVSAR